MRASAWAQLFAQGDPLTLLKALAGAIGFQEPARLDARTGQALGIAEEVHPVILARGPGTTRLVGAVAVETVPLREQAARLADRLSRAAPHLLWLLVLVARDRQDIVIAAWHAGSGPVRIAALIVDGHGVLPSDAETLDALQASLHGIQDLEVHAQWVEILGREGISRRFFLALEQLVRRLGDGAIGDADSPLRRDVALLYVSRLLFLAFLQEREWLDGDRRFLVRAFDQCMATGGHFQRRVLRPLFFGTLNTPTHRRAPMARALGRIPFLNGGLFTRAAIERSARALVMRDEHFGELFDQLLVRYRFTPREETSTWQEAAIDPEILGRAFESLMASGERRVTGAFYTPLAIVTRVADAGLEAALVRRGAAEGIVDRVTANEALTAAGSGALRKALGGLRVLDPACGSGAFLVHLLDRLTRLRAAAGDARSPSTVRREVLSQCVFGVDVNPTAVWLCELRLWLSLAMEHPATEPGQVPPLPNLNHNIRCGDTLLAGDFAVVPGPSGDGRAGVLRARYARATGARKRHLARALERLERASLLAWLESRLGRVAAQRRSLVVAARGRDLFGGRRGTLASEREESRQLRVVARELRAKRRAVLAGGALPFVFAAHFPEAARAGGFDVIVGNPPWIRLHHIPVSMREALRREFRVYREAAWVAGAKAARAGAGFGSQVDAASLFVERGHQLLRGEGVMALLLPAKLWRSLAGGGVRRLLMERANLLALEDWSEAPALFDAATYPSLMVAARSPAPLGAEVRLAVHRRRLNIAWDVSRATLPLDESAGAPWVSLPPEARESFDRLARNGVALAASGLGVATLGVKCGCNAAYLVTARTHADGIEISDGVRSAVLPADLVRRVVRGEEVRAWRAVEGGGSMIFPHADDGRALHRLPSAVRNWLLPWRSRLEARSDARGHKAWWSLFRLDGARFDRPRVVWADLGKSLQALVLDAGDRTVPLNTCYVLAARDLIDAMALTALLNSPVADAWIGAIAEPARGGYRRHFAWTMARLPVPDDWARARDILAPLGERGLLGDPPGRTELLAAALDAFRMRHRTVAPLIEWIGH